ncbi:MAG: Uma2 family endonuclease, partial [Pyrinomonadaceae bacterium]
DIVRKVEEKVTAWLEAGARVVWVVSPKLHAVTVYRSLIDIVTLTKKDTLDGGDVVPGFHIIVEEIFRD